MDARARHRARTAVVLDLVWVVTLVVLFPEHGIAAAIGVVVLALGLLATRRPALGYVLALPRVLAALILVVPAVDNSAFFLASLVAAASAANGALAAHSRARRTGPAISKRVDEVGSAIILFGIVGLTLVGLLVDRRYAAAAGFLLWWSAFTWGTTGVHEAGHAFAALRTGNEVPDVRIGVGLTLFRVGRVSVGAVPFVGHTHWAVNEESMTSRKELWVVLAGPAANLLVGFALLAVLVVHWDALVFVLFATQIATALLNLVPFSSARHHVASDGARALRLLRATSLRR